MACGVFVGCTVFVVVEGMCASVCECVSKCECERELSARVFLRSFFFPLLIDNSIHIFVLNRMRAMMCISSHRRKKTRFRSISSKLREKWYVSYDARQFAFMFEILINNFLMLCGCLDHSQTSRIVKRSLSD